MAGAIEGATPTPTAASKQANIPKGFINTLIYVALIATTRKLLSIADAKRNELLSQSEKDLIQRAFNGLIPFIIPTKFRKIALRANNYLAPQSSTQHAMRQSTQAPHAAPTANSSSQSAPTRRRPVVQPVRTLTQ